ncbi:unnamed protein product [Arctogadus glacialis]
MTLDNPQTSTQYSGPAGQSKPKHRHAVHRSTLSALCFLHTTFQYSSSSTTPYHPSHQLFKIRAPLDLPS